MVVRDGRACGACDRCAARSGRVRFHPESQHRFAITSLEEAPDWCISRQLWWGHQLPIWYCPDGHTTVTVDEPSACAECGSGELEREADVLDTWFSSALWPFATLGWPDETPELARYYPGTSTATAREIIRLWENRMICSASRCSARCRSRRDHPLDGARARRPAHVEEPRHRDRPEEALEEYGADATRYGLLKISSTQDVRFSYGAIEEGRKLAIKLWNVARLILQNAGRRRPAAAPPSARGALDSRATRRRPRRARGLVGRFDLSPSPPRRSTTSRSTTSATGTRRPSSRGSTIATRRRSRRRSRRSSGSSRSSIR